MTLESVKPEPLLNLKSGALLSAGAAGLLILSSSIMTFAKGPGHMDDFFDAINASDMQEKQLESVHMQYMSQMTPVKDAIAQRKIDLINYILSPGATKDEAMRRENEIQGLKAQVGQLAVEEAFAKKALLTPEQQQKAVAFFQKKAQDMKNKPMKRMGDD